METVKIGQEQIDRFTGFPVVLTLDHTYIHQGIGFNLPGESGSVAAGATYAIAMQVPIGTFAHFRPTAWSSTANVGEMKFYEASTFTGGSPLTPVNHNRNSKNISKLTCTAGVTATNTSAILLSNETVGAGGNPVASAGGGGGQNDEWVLRPGRTYVFQFENIGSTTATVFYHNFFWYEEQAG